MKFVVIADVVPIIVEFSQLREAAEWLGENVGVYLAVIFVYDVSDGVTIEKLHLVDGMLPDAHEYSCVLGMIDEFKICSGGDSKPRSPGPKDPLICNN